MQVRLQTAFHLDARTIDRFPSMIMLNLKNVSLVKAVALLMCVWLDCSGIANASGHVGGDGCAELDETQSAGGEPEETRSLKLGRAVGVDRSFEIHYDFYSIRDRMVVTYNGSGNKPQTLDTGLVNGVGTLTFTIPAGSTPLVQITMNPGNGLSGTAWIYTPTETTENEATEITLGTHSWPDEQGWRNTLGGNSSAEQSVQLDPPPKDATPDNNFYRKTFSFEVPAGTTCLRVSAVGTQPGAGNKQNGDNPASIIVSKHCPPVGFLSSSSSPALANSEWRNTIVRLPEQAEGDLSGEWFVTVFKRPSARKPSSGGLLRIDCLQGGKWKVAEVADGTERQRIAVGIEGGSLPPSGRLLLLSHGRVDSPLGAMRGLGEALQNRWGGRTPYHVNWSEGSYWNGSSTKSLIGSRFVSPAAAQIAVLIKGATVDYFGHSWGTYMGNELARLNGPFARFFALDPAYGLSLSEYNHPVNFSQRANYSMAIYGDGLYGSAELAATARDSIILDPPLFTGPGTRHTEPILVMANFVRNAGIGAKQMEFALGDSGVNLSQRPWKNVRKFEDDFQVKIKTDGTGVVSKFSYYIEQKGSGGTVVDKKIDITK